MPCAPQGVKGTDDDDVDDDDDDDVTGVSGDTNRRLIIFAI
jgi:hypothetical protein